MNDKAKKILSYVACAIAGACLGIALLGGLSYCSTSSAREKENTILATKKNAVTTDQSTNITSYTFDINSYWTLQTSDMATVRWYDFDTTTYEPTLLSTPTSAISVSSYPSLQTYISETYESKTVPTGKIYFLAIWGRSSNFINYGDKVWYYFSFKLGEYDTYALTKKPMVETNINPELRLSLSTYTALTARNNTMDIPIIPYEENNTIGLMNVPSSNTTASFVDIESYYKKMGYSAGHTAGYSEGYDDAYAEKDSGIAFTSCGVYPNAHVTLATDETIGNFNYMYLCHYITKPGYDEHTIYILWTTNANTGQYLGQVIDRNDSDSYDPAVTLGSFTQQNTSSVTITANEDMEFGLWVGYITTFHNRGEITNSILWFQGGTSESDMQIYQNGYDEGYQNGNQQGQETGYQNGYTEGKQAGDAEGYERGYSEGFEQTNTQNVFSLFTSAFGAVSSFFDLKIFGFLPLYWFFLAPLFIALISLLMRMVRH